MGKEAEWLNNLPKGSERTGIGANTRTWSTLRPNHYLSSSRPGVNTVGAGQSKLAPLHKNTRNS